MKKYCGYYMNLKQTSKQLYIKRCKPIFFWPHSFVFLFCLNKQNFLYQPFGPKSD